MLSIDYSLLLQLFNVLLLIVLLKVLFVRPLVRVLDERTALTEGSLNRAGEQSRVAATKLAQYEERIQGARREMLRQRQALLTDLRQERGAAIAGEVERQEKRFAAFQQELSREVHQLTPAVEAESRALAALIADRLLGERQE